MPYASEYVRSEIGTTLEIPREQIGKPILLLNIALAAAYFFVITFLFAPGNRVLYAILIAGEVFHVWQILTYIHTIWNEKKPSLFDPGFHPPVDVYITVAGEPEEIIEATVNAAMRMRYPDFNVYILNDGLVAQKANWREAERVARRHGARVITRWIAGGAKAGNINFALRKTKGPFVAIFDADHIPHPDFLEKTVGYFVDPGVAFIQSPQYYRNNAATPVASAAWEQQQLFFGAICCGKTAVNAAFMCGTNMLIRRDALADVGGMCETNITEDFLTSLFIHERKWKSVYIPEVLAEGLAPEDFFSYCSQQYRWARGGLELIFKFAYNPLFRRKLTRSQKIQYLASAGYYLSGIVVITNAVMPLLFFYFGLVPFKTPTMVLAAVFLPYMFLTVYLLTRSSMATYTFRALAFSMGSCVVYTRALYATLTGRRAHFAVTSKTRLSGNFTRFTMPHMLYVALVVIGISWAFQREGPSASVIDNAAWAIFNVAAFLPFILASFPAREPKPMLLGDAVIAAQDAVAVK